MGFECRACGRRYEEMPNECECGSSLFFKLLVKPTAGEIKIDVNVKRVP
jgi:DNA-directed RNA polymerase subunit RPC12/RpoP